MVANRTCFSLSTMPVLRTHARWSRKQGSGATHVGVQACWFIRIYGLITTIASSAHHRPRAGKCEEPDATGLVSSVPRAHQASNFDGVALPCGNGLSAPPSCPTLKRDAIRADTFPKGRRQHPKGVVHLLLGAHLQRELPRPGPLVYKRCPIAS